jgi:rubrerythrin
LKLAVDSEEGKALLSYLADAENEHKERLESILNRFGGGAFKTEIDALVAEILMEEGTKRIFKGLMEKSKLDKMDAIEAVRLGIGVENRSIDFYTENAKKSYEPDMVELFEELTTMEREHLEILSDNLRNLENEGAWYGYVPILEG